MGTESKHCNKCGRTMKHCYYIEVCTGGISYPPYTKYYDRYHVPCYAKAKKVRKPSITSDLSNYGNLSLKYKYFHRNVDRYLFPNLVNTKDIPKLKLSKKIDDMKMKELKLELQKRDLRPNGKKAVLAERLRIFMNHTKRMQRQNKKNSEMLAIGYCAEITNKYSLIMPVYLKQIVEKYYGIIEY